jgi:hypothetical protein
MNSHTQRRNLLSLTPNQYVAAELPEQRSPLALFAVLATLLAALTLSGCVGLTSAGTPAKTSSGNPPYGTLAASATSFSFGNVATGSSNSQTLTLTNTGTAAVAISQATVAGAGFSVVGGMTSVSIAAGQNQAFQIQFAPQTPGNVSGSVVVASDASDPTLSVSLSGNGMATVSITTQPASQTVTTGQTATFAVAATGTGTLSYQWKKNGSTIGGATSASYTTPATANSDNGAQFTVVVSDSTSSLTSATAILTVTAAPVAPSITTQPASKTVVAGQTATFSVTAAGTATLMYQWNKNATPIGGATSASYTTPATANSDNGAQFTVTVTNSVGKITSSTAALTVTAATFLLNTNKTSLPFGNVNIGSNTILGVTFTNAGNSNVTVLSVTIAGPGFTPSGVSTGQILTPGQTATLNVTFTPATAVPVTGSVTVASTATNSPATITLSGTGVQPVPHSVTLSWTASTSTVPGYNVYRSAVSGGPYTKVNSVLDPAIQYTDSTVQSGLTYFFVVTSVDSSNVESTFSNEVSATIP